ncbi:Magnesium transporter NIPA3 [Auxenochlorella protothecoides]|uniref:Probable magnesium transporter n=1 Tax=Auxenochlorella protothecoides TaxID=3075 RepID=A0A087SBQ1_AUXPR|nr:Magnesium transporter NIPA3 [Auxenochlorella protothecoides]KFM23155.1 Magnesium transporter NIPA3 [Auxenochlorella protothecoides]
MAPALQGLSALGAVLHVGGSLLIVVGQTVVKISHCIKESSGMPHTWLVPRHASPKPQWQRPDGQWRRLLVGSRAYAVAGWGLFAGGNLLRFVSMRFASQTVLSGLGSLQFVLIPVASQALLGVRADRSAALGVLVVVAGNVLIVWHGPGDVEYSVAALRALWQARTMRAFLLAMALALTALQLICLGFALPWSGTWVTADAAQVFTGALLYSAVASMIGAWSVLFSKSLTYVVSELPDSLADPYGWFVAAAFLGTAAWWIRQSNQGLRLYPASLIMPLMQAFWMCMSVLEGGIYFQELDHLPASSIWLLMTGLVMALAGAIFMGVAGFVAERRLVTENEVLEAGRAGSGLKTSFALVPGSELGPEGSGVDLSYARRAETLSTPQYRAAAAAARLDAFAPLVPGQTGLLPGGNSPLSRSQTLEESPLAALELAASPRDALASPTSPSSIREVVIDSQRLLRSGAGGLLHRVTQAFH